MKKFKIKIEGKTFEVSVTEQDKGVAEIIVNGKPYTVEFERENTAPASKPSIAKRSVRNTVSAPQQAAAPAPKKPAGSAKSVKSPLPGSIFKIPVSVGQEVKRGDQLVIIESMKMENNILADRDGIVKAIHVHTGQSVLQGDALLDLE
ncbi:MAG: biotin/lipoyl-binding protein [Prevotellaceae bacterium]|jgi:biotin carboxyl carrier protein|nr:biotin/lipoyl-binding protein [Prevotellaceae bacterium]